MEYLNIDKRIGKLLSYIIEAFVVEALVRLVDGEMHPRV